MIRLRCRWPFEPWRCSCCGRVTEGKPPFSHAAGLACDVCLDLGRIGEPFIPLTVGMVAPTVERDARPIVAVCMRQGVCVTEQGELFDLPGLVERIRERKPGELGKAGPNRDPLPDQLDPCLVVTDQGVELTGYLDQSAAADSPYWNWQLGLRAQSAWRPEAKSRSRAEFLVPKPVRFGYAKRQANGKRRAKGKSRWYQLLDVHEFCELPDGWGRLDAAELLRFGLELRAWANANQLPLLTSASAYGGRLLRDARFGGGWRRKVPGATNATMRRRLPGNHYQLLTAEGKRHARVHKIDQAAAHHHAALMTRFPHPDLLNAEGWFRRPPPREGSRADTRGAIPGLTDRWRELLTRPGMFTLAVHVDERVALDSLQLPQLRQAGTHWRTLTSIEVEHARQLPGVGLGDIWACWTSPEVDERLNEYAWWALSALEGESPARKRWLKPALLSAYGLLAAKPRRFRNAWRYAHNPDGAVGFPTRYGQLVGYERSTKREREPQTANVLWRALIESRVRLESLKYAQQLRGQGFRPISIYADAVFAIGRGVPQTPAPWRYEGVVHELIFESSARYRSREESRLPGTPRRGGLQRVTPKHPTTGGAHAHQQ